MRYDADVLTDGYERRDAYSLARFRQDRHSSVWFTLGEDTQDIEKETEEKSQ